LPQQPIIETSLRKNILIGHAGKTAPTQKSTREAGKHLSTKSGIKERHMEISNNNPVSNQVQGLEATTKASEVKREEGEVKEQTASQTEENPDYRLSLSEEAKQATAEFAAPSVEGQAADGAKLSDEEAVQLAQQTSAQLAQTDASISNQAIQQAIDLFT
jgi:hypothetical protein